MSQLADVLAARGEELLRRWVESVRQHVAPGGESRAELVDHIPHFLQQLETILRGQVSEDRTSPEAGTNPVGREHGAQRFQLGFALGELVREYGLLRDLLLDVIEKEGLHVPLSEVRLLTNFVATAITEAVEEHARQEERARREVQQAEVNRLSTLLEQMPALIAHVSGPEHVFTLANAAFRRLVGGPPLLGRPVREVFPDPRHASLLALLEGVYSTGEPHQGSEVEVRLARGDTEAVLAVDFLFQPLRDAEGRVEGILLFALDVTERLRERRVKERLQEELLTFKSLIEASDDYIAITNLQGSVVYMNPAGLRLAGLSSMEQARATPMRDFVTRDAQQTLALEVVPTTLAGRSWQGEVPLRSFSTGEVIPLAARTVPIKDEQGRVELLGTINRDIREAKRQQAERERLLEETERLRVLAEGGRARLHTLFMQAPVCIGIIRGIQVVIELANPHLCHIWGRTQEQVVGKTLLEALPELREYGFDDLLRGVMTTGETFVATEMAIQLARGEGGALETGYFNFTYSAMRDERGRPESVLVVASEVTEMVLARQEVEVLLRRSQEAEQARASVLEALAAQTLVAVAYQRGPELVFETANPLYRHIVGRDVVGSSVPRALPEVTGQHGFPSRLTRVFETGEPLLMREVPVQVAQGPDGPLREGLFDLTYQPVRGPGGGIDGVLTLIFEVTEQVQLRQKAQHLAEEERTRRDFEQHLIGIVSHDLRNPLGAISLGLQVLLRRPDLDARTQQSLVRIQSSTGRAVRLVRDLLDFTQARLGGGLKIERSPMDVHALVRGVVEENQVTHPERELRLEQGGEGRGEWDADRLSQLVGNLLGNALKYSPAGSPVTVRSLGGPEQVRLEVHNSGAPIAPEAMGRLFQPLQRAVEGPGTDTAGRSVGLGLYIVAQIVRAHGGRIQVTSTEHEGTTFSVLLPRSA